MQLPRHHSRINLTELKARIEKKLGPEGSKLYFHYLNRFLSLKLNKVEFCKLCLKILGHDNIPLHNNLMRSILKNACAAKIPSPQAGKKAEISKHSAQIGDEITSAGVNGFHHSVSQILSSGLSNGIDVLSPSSPRKARSVLLDRRSGDCLSTLGPHKTREVHEMENGDTYLVMQQSKDSLVRRSDDDLLPVYSKDNDVRDEGKEASTRVPLEAPLGVFSTRRRALSSSNNRYMGISNNGSLLDNLTLREQMEQISIRHGLEGVSAECASIMNLGLDCYVKGLIRSCIELAGTRSTHDSTTKNDAIKQLSCVNGVDPGHQYQLQNRVKPLQQVQEQHRQRAISLRDIRVAMQLNPRQLGEDWPLLLERICTRAFEE